MKLVVNRCFGGFNLSPRGKEAYLARKGKKAYFYKQTEYKHRGGVDKYVKVTNEHRDLFAHTLTVDLGDETDELKYGDGEYLSVYEIPRDDPDLVAVVEELGDKANGNCAKLEVVEIPDGVEWGIDEYDGKEHVAEAHRTW